MGVVGALIFCALQIFPTGDRAAHNAAEHQPATFAAMEGLFETQKGAPLVIIGNPDTEKRKLDSTDRDAEAPVVPDLAPLGRDDDRAERHPARTAGPTPSRSSTTRTTSWSGSARSCC